MSLGIMFKGPEGLVLAADSRVTLTFQPVLPPPPPGAPAQSIIVVPAFFDNATKLLRCAGQKYVAAVTYGLGALGTTEPRTAHSFLPELEAELADQPRLPVAEFAKRLAKFFLERFEASGMVATPGNDMCFLVGGYNEGEPYGKIYEVTVPTKTDPVEMNAGTFGVAWGGQTHIVHRLVNGFDRQAAEHLRQKLNLDQQKWASALQEAGGIYSLKIPYQFLPLQDCIDLSILLVKTTSQLMQYTTDVRGVGGAVDVATITRTEGYKNVQGKEIRGDRSIQ
jgi:hypothetical protein